MIKYSFFIIISFLFIRCEQSTDSLKASKEKIVGDWYNHNISFSFEDSLCSFLSPFNETSKFKIKNDTLIIENQFDTFTFNISAINDSILGLIPLDKFSRSYFAFDEVLNKDTLMLTKMYAKNNEKLASIGFRCSMCFGTCPSMSMMINKNGEILFHGKSYTEIEGFYSGNLSKPQLNYLEKKIQNIQLDSLQNSYRAHHSDDQTCYLYLKTENKEINVKVYGSYDEPKELKVLMYKVKNIYKYVNLKKDSTVEEKFKLNNYI